VALSDIKDIKLFTYFRISSSRSGYFLPTVFFFILCI